MSFVLRRYRSLGDSEGEVGGAKKKNEVNVCVCALYSYLMQIIVKQFESISNAVLDFVGWGVSRRCFEASKVELGQP